MTPLVIPPALAIDGLLLARWLGLVLVAPGWSTVPIPPAVRGALVLWCGVLVLPFVHLGAVAAPTNWIAWGIDAGIQSAVGALMGFVCAAALAAFPAAAALLQSVLGLALFTPAEPSLTADSSGLPLWWTLLGAIVFFADHGLQWLVLAYQASFRAVPVTGVIHALAGWRVAAAIAQLLFSTALELAGPGLAIALGLYLTVGFLARAFPTLNIYFALAPGIILGLLAVLTLAVTPEATWSGQLWHHTERLVGEVMGAWHG